MRILIVILSSFCFFTGVYSDTISIVPKDEQISDFEAKLELAHLFLFDSTKKEDALKLFKELIKDRPEDSQLHYDLGMVYSSLGKYEEAKNEFEYILSCDPNFKIEAPLEEIVYMEEEPMYIIKKVDKAYPSDDNLMLVLAEAYNNNLQMQEAIDTYKYLIEREKNPPLKAMLALGDIYIKKGMLEEALIYYRKVLEKEPSSNEIKMKVAQLLSWTKNLSEAYHLLSELYGDGFKESIVAIEISRTYEAHENFSSAKMILEKQIKKDPENISLQLELAKIEAELGYSKKAKKIYDKVLSLAGSEGYISSAEVMQIWGDFWAAEKKYQKYLLYADRDKEAIELKLAWLYVSTERYDEAKTIYRKLLKDDRYYGKAALDFSRAFLKQKDYEQAIILLLELINKRPNNLEVKALLAEAYFKAKRYDKAVQEYSILASSPFYARKAELALGEIYYKEDKRDLSIGYFEKVKKEDPKNVEAAFYLYLLGKGDLSTDYLSSEEITSLGNLFLQKGCFYRAVLFFENALKKDIDYDPAYFGLVEALSVNHEFDRAINILNGLNVEFPENYKMQLWRARALGWARRYDESIEEYEILRKTNPKNTILIKEEARVAFWQENIQLSMYLYNLLLFPSSDYLLKKDLENIIKREDCSDLYDDLDKYSGVYEGYELTSRKFYEGKYNLSQNKKTEIENVFSSLDKTYSVQKEAFLEKQSKSLIWEKRYSQSLGKIEKLLSFDRGNEESMFDLGQSQCNLGLCDRSKKTYARLVDIDPLHNLALIALERSNIVSRPSIDISPSYWEEFGRGEIDQIRRVKVISCLNIPIHCRNSLYASYDYYLERPTFTNDSYFADGLTVGTEYIFSPYFKSGISFTKKYYRDSIFKDTTTGHVFAGVNFNDYLHLGFGYMKKDEIDNYFTLVQKTQLKSWIISYETDLSHRLNFKGDSWIVEYSDNNPGQYHMVDLAFAFTDLPMIFKASLLGEYRDLRHTSIYIYNQEGDLLNILYPYWTPVRYKAIKVLFDFYHDLSPYLICGEAKHFYSVKMAFGTDTEKNDAFYVEGAWHLELKDRYVFSLRLMAHRSIEWNSSGGWFTFKVRF